MLGGFQCWAEEAATPDRFIVSLRLLAWTLDSTEMAAGTSGQSRTQVFDRNTLLRAHPFFKDLGDAVIERLAPRVINSKIKGKARSFSGKVTSARGSTPFVRRRESALRLSGQDAIFNLIVPGELFGRLRFSMAGKGLRCRRHRRLQLMIIERRDFIP
jgi:hypothetical protein